MRPRHRSVAGVRAVFPYRYPAPLLVLRTLRSDTLVGIEPSLQARLGARDEDWRTSGVYGVDQLAA